MSIFKIIFLSFLISNLALANQRDKEKQKLEAIIEQGAGDFDIKSNIQVTGNITATGNIESKSNFSIGSVQQSILTEAQFQALNGTEWVKMRGQAIAGSKLCTQYSICTLPSAEGRFLRDSIADAGLGTIVNDTTAKNGLSNSPSSISGTSAGGTWSFSGTTPQTQVETNSQGVRWGTANFTGTTYATWGDQQTTSAGLNVVVPSMTVSGSVTRSTSSSVSGSAAAQTITGDAETAPNHVILNTFIKIN